MWQLIFLRKSDCLGCAVLLCLVVYLTLLATFFLPSHLSSLTSRPCRVTSRKGRLRDSDEGPSEVLARHREEFRSTV